MAEGSIEDNKNESDTASRGLGPTNELRELGPSESRGLATELCFSFVSLFLWERGDVTGRMGVALGRGDVLGVVSAVVD